MSYGAPGVYLDQMDSTTQRTLEQMDKNSRNKPPVRNQRNQGKPSKTKRS